VCVWLECKALLTEHGTLFIECRPLLTEDCSLDEILVSVDGM